MSEVQKGTTEQTSELIDKDDNYDPPIVEVIDGESNIAASRKSVKRTFGTESTNLMDLLLDQTRLTLPRRHDDDFRTKEINGSLAMLYGIEPQDELEGMLSAQMVAVHGMAMEMARRVTVEGQLFDGANANVNNVTKLMRTFTSQMEALQKYRTKGQKTIQVQHVQVNDGGQAIVGNVKTGGGGNE
jgi:hypothetical protein